MNFYNHIVIYKKSLNNETVYKFPCVTSTFRLVFISQGQAIWKIGSNEYKVKENDFVFLNNQEKRIFKAITSQEDLIMLIIEFEPEFLSGSPLTLLYTERTHNYQPVTAGTPELFALAEEVETEAYDGNNSFIDDILSAKVRTMLVYLARIRHIEQIEPSNMPTKMQQVLNYIDRHFKETITLKQLAEVSYMSQTGLSKYFKKHMHIPLSQYIQRKRIEHAILLLKTTDYTILTIALECGFNNTANFYKAFKAITSSTPSNFRF